MALEVDGRGDEEVCVLLDGDQQPNRADNLRQFLSLVQRDRDKEVAREWAERRIEYLPGDSRPEAWACAQVCDELIERLERELAIPPAEGHQVMHAAQAARPHSEFFEASTLANVSLEVIRYQILKGAIDCVPEERERVTNYIQQFLE